jgi:hypothetical protein
MTANRIWERALMGSRWLVKHQHADGSWMGLSDPQVDAFYKGSWPLILTGQPAAAHRMLNYTRQHFMTAEGDFIPRGHPWHTNVHYVYANVYFIIGSMVAGRYEVAMPAVRFILGLQDPDHGGLYSRRPQAGHKEFCDTMSAGAAGAALLAAGQMDAALRVAGFLSHIVELQPAPDDRFYTTIQAGGQLGTEFEDDQIFWRVVDTRIENQCWYAVGLPFAFLIRLAEATGKARHRDLAQWFFDFQTRCVDPWDGGSSGKAGWGCAMLYRITGDKQYRDIALHIAGNIMDRQNADGGWASLKEGYGESDERALINSDFDVTSEFTLWLALIAANVLARDA